MIFWCDKCNVPVFDRQLHGQICNGKMKAISKGTTCNPVFRQEKKLLSKIVGKDLENKTLWYLGASNYYFDGKLTPISYMDWYKEKRHFEIAEELLTKLKYPSLTVFGNHDMAQLKTLDKDAPPYINKTEALEIIKKCNPFYIFDKPYYAFSPRREYRVIVLDTTVDDRITANGILKDEQAEFLKNEIESHKDKVILIFEHHPVVEPFKSEHHRIINSDKYMDIIKKYKKTPIAIFSGHYHAAKIIRQGNIIHISTPSLVTYPNAFRYVNITNYKDRTIFNFRYIETRLYEVQKKSKMNAIAQAALRGMPNDHNVTITIRKSKDNNNEYKEEKPKTIKEDKEIQKEMQRTKKQLQKEQKAKEKAKKKIKRIKDLEETQKTLYENADSMSDKIQPVENPI